MRVEPVASGELGEVLGAFETAAAGQRKELTAMLLGSVSQITVR